MQHLNLYISNLWILYAIRKCKKTSIAVYFTNGMTKYKNRQHGKICCILIQVRVTWFFPWEGRCCHWWTCRWRGMPGGRPAAWPPRPVRCPTSSPPGYTSASHSTARGRREGGCGQQLLRIHSRARDGTIQFQRDAAWGRWPLRRRWCWRSKGEAGEEWAVEEWAQRWTICRDAEQAGERPLSLYQHSPRHRSSHRCKSTHSGYENRNRQLTVARCACVCVRK